MQRQSRDRSRSERGSVLMVALFVMLALSLLGVTMLTLSGTEYNIAYNLLWSEGAFAAAEAGIQTGMRQLGPDPSSSITKIPAAGDSLPIGTGTYTYQYRSGPRTAAAPMPLTYRGNRIEGGYSLAQGTGYNCSGYVFHSYQINATGTGPRNAQREIEVLAEYGPVCQ